MECFVSSRRGAPWLAPTRGASSHDDGHKRTNSRHLSLTTPTAIKPSSDKGRNTQLGAEIRRLRKSRGLSQGALAEAVGIAQRQLQKYEVGTIRVPATTLFLLSVALKFPITAFFDPQGEFVDRPPPRSEPLDTVSLANDTRRLVKVFSRIRDPALRAHVIAIIKRLSDAIPTAR